MEYFFTGRIDMLEDDYDMIGIFNELVTKFVENDTDEDDFFGFTFEDKTKTGLPTKPHYHFFFKSVYKLDTIRKYITTLGFPGAFASMKIMDINDPKWKYYIFKQGEVVFTSLNEELIAAYIADSLNYNETLKPTLNTFKDHMLTLLDSLDRSKEYAPYKVFDVTKTGDERWDNGSTVRLDRLIQKYIKDHILEFQLPCRQTYNHWLITFTSVLCPHYADDFIELFYLNSNMS